VTRIGPGVYWRHLAITIEGSLRDGDAGLPPAKSGPAAMRHSLSDYTYLGQLLAYVTRRHLELKRLYIARIYLLVNRCVVRVCYKSTRHWLTAAPGNSAQTTVDTVIAHITHDDLSDIHCVLLYDFYYK